MQRKGRLISLLAAVAVALSVALPVGMPKVLVTPAYAESTSYSRNNLTPQEKNIMAQAILDQRDGRTEDAARELEALKSFDPTTADILEKVFKYWDWAEQDMTVSVYPNDPVPTGLPDPSHHAFIVLGYALDKDGTMKPELIGRLEATYAVYEQYPDAYFYVTGGVPQNGHTEGELMKKWLEEKGVPADHVFAETKAPNTAGNASNTFEMIYDNPEIRTVSVISSGYHVRRGALLLYAESLYKAAELGREPIEFLSKYCYGWLRPDLLDETRGHRANTLSQISRCNAQYKQLDVSKPKPDTLTVTGRFDYEAGDDLAVKVTFTDAQGVSHDVTAETTFTGAEVIQDGNAGPVTATYVHDGKTYTVTFNVSSHGRGWYREMLRERLEDAEGTAHPELYTLESWTALQDAIAKANKVVADGDSSDLSVAREALDELSNALLGLHLAKDGEKTGADYGKTPVVQEDSQDASQNNKCDGDDSGITKCDAEKRQEADKKPVDGRRGAGPIPEAGDGSAAAMLPLGMGVAAIAVGAVRRRRAA